ncbi:MAG: FGGY family carbohydrate kinase [Rectinemataceae bacterium]
MAIHELIVGIDIGTTGTKACIFTPEGRLEAKAYREYGCTFPRPGWVEQDLSMLIETAMATCAEAVGRLEKPKAGIRAVSFSTQRTCTIFLDEKEQPIRPMISWQDNRTQKEMAAIKDILGEERFHSITGLPLNTTWCITKLLWLRNNEPENWKRLNRFSQLQDYVLRSFGVEGYVTDKAAVSLSGLYDLKMSRWSEEILGAFDMKGLVLPEVRKAGSLIGKVSLDASRRSGLPEGTPICVGAGDQNSAAIGAGVVQEGMMSISLGTGGLVAAFLKDYPESLSTEANIMNHAIDGSWELEGYQAGAASVYKWFRDQVATLEKAYAESTGQDAYDILSALASQAPPGSKGLLFLPYLASACAPRWNPNARGSLLGLTFAHDKACLLRASIEGITMEVRDILTSMTRMGLRVQSVRILGGPTKSELWNQMQADIYNRRVETLKFTDTAVLGAAIFAGVGVGIFPSIAEAAKKLVKVSKIYEPNPDAVATYNRLYEVYAKAYEALAGEVFDMLANF